MEYVIWGIIPGETKERLIFDKTDKGYITDKEEAKEIARYCEIKGCTEVRIQEVNRFDFVDDYTKKLEQQFGV